MIKTCTVEQDEITKAVGKMFDYDFDGTIYPYTYNDPIQLEGQISMFD